MIKKGMVVFFVLLATQMFAANAPIQRIDIVNLLWNDVAGVPGSTDTPILIAFYNGGTIPCYTTTVPFRAAITVWAGIGQACITPVSDLTITPVANPVVTYAPAVIATLSGGYYVTELTVSQNSPPLFDPSNGAVLAPGTAKTTLVNYISM
jgi:hypothetical protein